jgi:hypothetical protein
MLDFEKIIERVVQQSPLRLVAIDGLPLRASQRSRIAWPWLSAPNASVWTIS